MDFKLDDCGFSWVAEGHFPSWAGYVNRSSLYGSQAAGVASDGRAEVVFAPEGRDASPMTAGELSLVEWFVENEAAVSAAVKEAIFRDYPRLQAVYGYAGCEKVELMPDLSAPEDLRPLIGLSSINVHQIAKAGLPYLGFEFGCAWDDEHGLGVLMHGTRVVKVGGSDTAGLLWIAERDARLP